MTKETLADILDNREYNNEIDQQLENLAEENGLIVIFGSSDDLMEFRGAIYDEFGCWRGGTVFLTKEPLGYMQDSEDDGELPDTTGLPNKVTAVFGGLGKDVLWTYKTELPHATFNIIEDGEVYCRGIVIDTKDLS